MTKIEITNSLSRLSEFLKTHYRTTVMIFEHYAANGHSGGKGSMDRGEFWKLIKDVYSFYFSLYFTIIYLLCLV